jgi:hemoglobin
MRDKTQTLLILGALVMATLSVAVVEANDAEHTPSVAEQIAGLQAMCAETEQARVQRQADEALYYRLGGYDRIHEFIREVVRLHFENDALDRIMVGVDGETLAKRVADFAAAGTGGPQTYTGRSMPAAHEHLHLTDADFLEAGGDIVKAMQTLDYGEDEINEFVCILVSLKDQVVLK